MRTCKQCKWFEYQRGASGRVLPSQRGTCSYDVETVTWPLVLPMIVEKIELKFRQQPFDTSNADGCHTFAPKGEKKPKILSVTPIVTEARIRACYSCAHRSDSPNVVSPYCNDCVGWAKWEMAEDAEP